MTVMEYMNAHREDMEPCECVILPDGSVEEPQPSHIKKLEGRMGGPLFERVPYMALTPAGKVLYRSLRRIELIERSCRKNIEAIWEGTQGEVTLGMNAGRVQFFLPRLYEAYHRKFPYVTLKVVIDDVKNQARRLLDGKIDFLVGVNCPVNRELVFTPLKEEKVFFLATDSYLKAHAKSPGAYPKTLRTGIIDTKEYDTLPLVQNAEASTLATVVERYEKKQNLVQDTLVRVSDSNAQIRLCGTGLVGMYLAESLVEMARFHGSETAAGNPLRILAIKELTETLRLDLVTHREADQPLYIRQLEAMIRDVFASDRA
ncbi:LysR family transcriptional regulator [uncultured Acidaminococcus sp.]|uniref:LysR family transcriptional regulator n=1 Tax=uncultured Acidaminococcus sp. TaxID=352152 RepID=UPI002625F5BE|nr:LysR family transcriptional regulator [uncultured Acidaminococcus sp.]